MFSIHFSDYSFEFVITPVSNNQTTTLNNEKKKNTY